MRGVWITHEWGGRRQASGPGDLLIAVLLRWAINAVSLLVAARVVGGIELHGWESTIIVAALFGLVNTFIRPVVLVMTCLLQVVTLGLFTLVVNAAMLALTAWMAGKFDLQFQVDGFGAAFLGALVITVVSFVLSRLAPSPRKLR